MPAATATIEAARAAAFDRLAAAPVAGYSAQGEHASEPTAWAALALAGAGRDAAPQAAEWLAARQSADGSVGVTASQAEPCWPTALAMLAWRGVDAERFAPAIDRAANWALHQSPWTAPRDPRFGHDTTLAGWSWAPATHSWLEPTAFFVAALRATEHRDHPRRLEAVGLLVDRLLPSGGANYGNTTVFGQTLLQHVHSSGVAAWALGGESVADPRLGATLDYLADAVARPTGAASLAWAARGLAAHGRADAALARRVAEALDRVGDASLHKTALLTLALQEIGGPL